VLRVVLTVVTIGALNLALLILLVPIWFYQAAGLLVIGLLVAAVDLALIVLSALRPVSWPSRAGRVLLTAVAIAALNFVLNLVWTFTF
jgi:hypothetical protein